ncbi:EamA family transporter [Virgibacillus halophilus]|uniref:EamA family transporter n=1 Tax=Tigheibacillus halophilus TaxID=361280 RepID=A0ABU5C968_9BACI|nr:EamA family transporter [Virgibacillus halophilus]
MIFSAILWTIGGFFLLLAIVPTFLGHTLFNWAIRWLSTATISMGIIFEPVGSTILAYIILHEKVTGAQWLGGTIVIFGLMLFILSTKRKPKVTISRKH